MFFHLFSKNGKTKDAQITPRISQEEYEDLFRDEEEDKKAHKHTQIQLIIPKK